MEFLLIVGTIALCLFWIPMGYMTMTVVISVAAKLSYSAIMIVCFIGYTACTILAVHYATIFVAGLR